MIDDPIKPDDAQSDRVRDHVNELFDTTIRSRVNSRSTPVIIIMQRLHEDDLCGHLIRREPGDWTVLKLPALRTDPDGTEHALWEHMHTVEELHRLWEDTPFVFLTQYQQEPTPKEGLLYTRFNEYDTLPVGDYIVKNYTDTADTGSDDCASVDYAEFIGTGECYILDLYASPASVETSVPEIARMMDRDGVEVANIESNNGGHIFAVSVREALRRMGNDFTRIEWFTQRGNKEARLTNTADRVQNMIYWPRGWETRWPRAAQRLRSFRKEGRNAHDDIPDALTGVIEKRESGAGWTMRTGTYMRDKYD
ncbi:MAG: phage terminase large subunit [Prevotellaceae bacterium]|nr:phage terminase large subunit [Prevotellaceae bacterium]